MIKQVLVCGMLFSFVLLLGLEIGTSQTWVRNAEYKVDPFGANIYLCLEREIIVIPTWSKGTSLEQEMTNVANSTIKVTYESDLTGSSLKLLPGLT